MESASWPTRRVSIYNELCARPGPSIAGARKQVKLLEEEREENDYRLDYTMVGGTVNIDRMSESGREAVAASLRAPLEKLEEGRQGGDRVSRPRRRAAARRR